MIERGVIIHLPKELTIEDVIRATSAELNVSRDVIVGPGRHGWKARARHVAMFVAKRRLRVTAVAIGRAFGGRDHSTVLSAIAKIEAHLEHDQELQAVVDAVERRLVNPKKADRPTPEEETPCP